MKQHDIVKISVGRLLGSPPTHSFIALFEEIEILDFVDVAAEGQWCFGRILPEIFWKI